MHGGVDRIDGGAGGIEQVAAGDGQAEIAWNGEGGSGREGGGKNQAQVANRFL